MTDAFVDAFARLDGIPTACIVFNNDLESHKCGENAKYLVHVLNEEQVHVCCACLDTIVAQPNEPRKPVHPANYHLVDLSWFFKITPTNSPIYHFDDLHPRVLRLSADLLNKDPNLVAFPDKTSDPFDIFNQQLQLNAWMTSAFFGPAISKALLPYFMFTQQITNVMVMTEELTTSLREASEITKGLAYNHLCVFIQQRRIDPDLAIGMIVNISGNHWIYVKYLPEGLVVVMDPMNPKSLTHEVETTVNMYTKALKKYTIFPAEYNPKFNLDKTTLKQHDNNTCGFYAFYFMLMSVFPDLDIFQGACVNNNENFICRIKTIIVYMHLTGLLPFFSKQTS
jgi:hypothetical protein